MPSLLGQRFAALGQVSEQVSPVTCYGIDLGRESLHGRGTGAGWLANVGTLGIAATKGGIMLSAG